MFRGLTLGKLKVHLHAKYALLPLQYNARDLWSRRVALLRSDSC